LLSVFIVFELKNLNSLQTLLAIGFCPADGKSCQKNLPFQIYFIDIAIIKRCKRKKSQFLTKPSLYLTRGHSTFEPLLLQAMQQPVLKLPFQIVEKLFNKRKSVSVSVSSVY
jgi:hypothetical protein